MVVFHYVNEDLSIEQALFQPGNKKKGQVVIDAITKLEKQSDTLGNYLESGGTVGQVLTAVAGGGIEWQPGPALIVSDTNSLDLSSSGLNLTGSVKVSSSSNNAMTILMDGLSVGGINGLTNDQSAGVIKIGGALTENTTIDGSTLYDWLFQNIKNFFLGVASAAIVAVNNINLVAGDTNITKGSSLMLVESDNEVRVNAPLFRLPQQVSYPLLGTNAIGTVTSKSPSATNTIDMQVGSNDILAHVKISGIGGNIINVISDGIYAFKTQPFFNGSFNELPDGARVDFTLNTVLSDIADMAVFKNGQKMKLGIDFLIPSPNNITFINAPLDDDILDVIFV